MPDPLILYSTSTWLAYVIGERFYRGEHYVWCTPDFDARALASIDQTTPASSSPAEIYRDLYEDVRRGDRHSSKVKDNKMGILRGIAASKLSRRTHPSAIRQQRPASWPNKSFMRFHRQSIVPWLASIALASTTTSARSPKSSRHEYEIMSASMRNAAMLFLHNSERTMAVVDTSRREESAVVEAPPASIALP